MIFTKIGVGGKNTALIEQALMLAEKLIVNIEETGKWRQKQQMNGGMD